MDLKKYSAYAIKEAVKQRFEVDFDHILPLIDEVTSRMIKNESLVYILNKSTIREVATSIGKGETQVTNKFVETMRSLGYEVVSVGPTGFQDNAHFTIKAV